MKNLCFMCGEEPGFTMEVWGRKERVCLKCADILIQILDKKAGCSVPIMIKVEGKYKAVRLGNQVLELTPAQISDLEKCEEKE